MNKKIEELDCVEKFELLAKYYTGKELNEEELNFVKEILDFNEEN